MFLYTNSKKHAVQDVMTSSAIIFHSAHPLYRLSWRISELFN